MIFERLVGDIGRDRAVAVALKLVVGDLDRADQAGGQRLQFLQQAGLVVDLIILGDVDQGGVGRGIPDGLVADRDRVDHLLGPGLKLGGQRGVVGGISGRGEGQRQSGERESAGHWACSGATPDRPKAKMVRNMPKAASIIPAMRRA